MEPKEATRVLEEVGAAQPGRLAALLDLEPEAVAIAAALLRGGVGEGEIEAAIREAEDPGAAIGRLAAVRGVEVPPGAPLASRAGLLARGMPEDRAEDKVREMKWAVAALAAINTGDPTVAEGWARRALEADGTDGSAAMALGLALRELGRQDEAASVLTLAFERAKEREGEGMEVAQLLQSLALVRISQEDLAEARDCLEKSLKIMVNTPGARESPGVSAVLHNLAMVLAQQGDLSGARSLLERSLEIETRLYGAEEHPSVADSLQELAHVLQAQGDLAGAREAIERSLRILATVYGTDAHPAIAAGLRALGGILLEQGDISGARASLERSIAINGKIYGTESHLSTANSLRELAYVLNAQGDLAGAKETLERAFRILRGVLGTEEHPAMAAPLQALAEVLYEQGDLDGALHHLERVYEIENRLYGDQDDSQRAMTEMTLGLVLLQMGADRRRIEELIGRAYQSFLAQLGPTHEFTREAAELLARLESSRPPTGGSSGSPGSPSA
ncbi:MAG TPA: tetratricopeptide repeat protein [Candidatus Nanopelagicales bacterium]|nr:tetratricopeptide repeat protein [Candidatus Nanopelagicales bacterium]